MDEQPEQEGSPSEADRVDASLAHLTETLDRIRCLCEQAAEQAAQTRERRSEGKSLREVAMSEDRPLVELVSRMIDNLIEAGGKLRRAQARALHEEGATMEEIGELFGVTRQRVSALLKATQETPAEQVHAEVHES